MNDQNIDHFDNLMQNVEKGRAGKSFGRDSTRRNRSSFVSRHSIFNQPRLESPCVDGIFKNGLGYNVVSGKISPTGAEDQEVEENMGSKPQISCVDRDELLKGDEEDDEMELKFFTPHIIQGEGSHNPNALDVSGQNLLNNMASFGGGISVAGSVASGSGASGRSVP